MSTASADVQAVLNSQDYYRLKQVVSSPGAIFEINESAKSIYIGPDSDIAEVQVTYVDPQTALGTQTATVSVNGPFVAGLNAFPKQLVPSTLQPGRILLSPVDLIDNAYASPLSVAHRSFNIPALIDVIISLRPLPEIPAVRADRTLRLPSVPFNLGNVGGGTNDGSTDIVVPIYGRRLVTISCTAKVAGGVVITPSLVTLLPGAASVPRVLGPFYVSSSSPPQFFSGAAVYRASDAGRNGVIYNSTGMALTGIMFESDMPPARSPTLPVDANPMPRGLADLMVINVKSPAGMGGALVYANLYVKLSDQET